MKIHKDCANLSLISIFFFRLPMGFLLESFARAHKYFRQALCITYELTVVEFLHLLQILSVYQDNGSLHMFMKSINN